MPILKKNRGVEREWLVGGRISLESPEKNGNAVLKAKAAIKLALPDAGKETAHQKKGVRREPLGDET